MDLIIGMLITFFTLIFSIYKGLFVGFPLLLVLFIFSFIAWRREFSINKIIKMSIDGGKKAFVVLRILLLIGGITSIWMASGTVPSIIYYGIQHINPHYFILYAFIITSIISFLLGTSFGTVSTVGVAFILIAQNGNINVNAAAGAIMAGSYFGDRCSPMSSSANLVSILTETNLFINIKNMFKTSILPFILSICVYIVLSLQHPLNFSQSTISKDLINSFQISWIVMLPAIIILILSILKISVKISMLLSTLSAVLIAIFVQHYSLIATLDFLVFGFRIDVSNPLHTVLKGGGFLSMWKPSMVVFISCTLAGIFNGTDLLKNIESLLMRAKTRFNLFAYTAITSIVTAALGCNQSITIVLTQHLMKKSYKNINQNDYHLAIDIENTGVVLAALIPWNIAAFVPTTTMGVSSAGFVPYASYLYLIPIVNLLMLKFFRKNKKLSNS